MGNESYSSNWARKVDIYDKYFQGMLIKTYESGAIAVDADKIIKELLEISYDLTNWIRKKNPEPVPNRRKNEAPYK